MKLTNKFYVTYGNVECPLVGTYTIRTYGLASLADVLINDYYNESNDGDVFVLADGEFLFENGVFKKIGDPIAKRMERYPIPSRPHSDEEQDMRKYLDLAITPLIDFLNEYFPKGKDQIKKNMMFMGNAAAPGGRIGFIYKNFLNGDCIMINDAGEIYYHSKDALCYDTNELKESS